MKWPWSRLAKQPDVVTDNTVRMPDGGRTVAGAPYLLGDLIVEAGTGRPLVRIDGPGGGTWTVITEDDPEYRRWAMARKEGGA